MPRNMSFALTTEQIRNRTKTVTRRVGWDHLWGPRCYGDVQCPGDRFWACVKCQGLKKGEKLERIALLECVSNTEVRLCDIDQADVVREGFPDMTPAQFVEMFCKHMKAWPNMFVNRIEFKYVDDDSRSLADQLEAAGV